MNVPHAALCFLLSGGAVLALPASAQPAGSPALERLPQTIPSTHEHSLREESAAFLAAATPSSQPQGENGLIAGAKMTDTPLDLHLEVFLQGVSTRLVAHVRQLPDGRLLMPPDQLRNVGLLPLESALREDGWVELGQLPGVQTRYIEATQTLYIEAEDAAMVLRVLDFNPQQWPSRGGDDPLDIPQHTGAFINHTLYWNSGGQGWHGLRQQQSASAFLDGHVYGRFGTLSSAHTVNATRGQPVRATRLDTQWSWFDERRLLTVSAGDLISSSLSWNRSVRMAGLQLRRNFSIRPDLITMPMLSGLSGSAAVPSTVEVYVNNARRFSQEVPAGPFSINNVPLITGGGTARLVVRDALGRETLSETPFYASSQLLAAGLSDFSLETGVARRDFGRIKSRYDHRLLASGTLRYGLSDTTTLEGHTQAGGGLALAGAGAVLRLGTRGVVALAAAASRYQRTRVRESGQQLAGNVELQGAGMRLFAQSQHTFGRFNDLASTTLDPALNSDNRRHAAPVRSMQQVSLGFLHFTQPSLNLSYTAMRFDQGQRSRLLGASGSYQFGRRGRFTLSLYRDLERTRSLSVYAGFSWFLGERLFASNSFNYRQGSKQQITAELSRSSPAEYGSLGWRVRGAAGQNQIAGAQASYRSRIGRVEVDVERHDNHTNGRVHVDGALVLAGGGVFLTNSIYNAFAVVNVGAPDVPVLYENNRIGRTNAHGRLLLTGLRAYERNLISIDPLHLPLDAHIPTTWQRVTPRYRSGTVVEFNLQTRPRVALVTLRDEDGALIPVGTGVRLNDVAGFVVGHDGQVWLENIDTHNRLLVTPAGAPACVVEWTAAPALQERLVIEDAICRRLP